MTAVVPPRAHQLAAFMCRLADELTAMGGTAELVAFHYVQSQATVRVTIHDNGAALRVAELMGIPEHFTSGSTAGFPRVWRGQWGAFTVEVRTLATAGFAVTPRVPLLHSGDVTEDAA